MLDWILGRRFDPPSAPLKDYWVTVHVRLHEPHAVEGHPTADSYIRILGVRCTPLRLPSLLVEQTSDGSIVSGKNTHWHGVSLNHLERSLRASISVQDKECIWHVSGRTYFPSSE